ncbi:hypothetical protein M407DRAFT_242096 [Tulasnella calospora MUT 4182]|uniref:F-box domain-containing protein n=1 Tax=Tulasnella calospora MUT 4182 TaxID=1051891 RepID=A0A0C3QQD3_9AGAM|nr:hypothetical protein M407DRAFT_242096 [Tulasnella calospora MUT 4182]
MRAALEASEYLGPLPLELFIHVLSLSLTEFEPIEALAHLEQLRLVSKAWRVTIDFTPGFGTTIPNDSKAASRMKEWIKKSGDAPLHIISNELTHFVEPFLLLLGPHVHR